MKRIEDERIITEKRKINSRAFSIALLALWGIILFRQLALKQNPMEYLDIFILTLGLSTYVTFKNVLQGFYLTYRSKNQKKKVNLLGAMVGLLTFITVQFMFMDYAIKSLDDIVSLMLSSIVFLVTWVVIQIILMEISERKANKDIE